MDVMNPTPAEARKLRDMGMPLPRGAAWSEGNEALLQDADKERLAALKQRVEEAKAKGETPSFSDLQEWEWAREHGLIQPAQEETAGEMIARGFREAEDKRQEDVAAAMKPLEDIANRALKMRRTVIWSDFRTKRAAVATTKALENEFEKTAVEVRDKFIRHVQTAEFRDLAEGHINQLTECFKEPWKQRD